MQPTHDFLILLFIILLILKILSSCLNPQSNANHRPLLVPAPDPFLRVLEFEEFGSIVRDVFPERFGKSISDSLC